MPNGSWQQTCTPIDTCEEIKKQSSQLQDTNARVLPFLVTTSLLSGSSNLRVYCL